MIEMSDIWTIVEVNLQNEVDEPDEIVRSDEGLTNCGRFARWPIRPKTFRPDEESMRPDEESIRPDEESIRPDEELMRPD